MDIERLRQAVIDKRFILSANPNWRDGRTCGLTDDKTEQKANDALTIILENIEELVVAYLIDARQSAEDKNVPTSEEVAEAIELFDGAIKYRKDQEEEVKKHYGGKLPDFYLDLNRKEALAIAALQAYQQWIPVGERLPDGDVASVLIHTNKGGVSEGQYYPSIKSWKQFRWSVENADVTHWKPLPAPPKGE